MPIWSSRVWHLWVSMISPPWMSRTNHLTRCWANWLVTKMFASTTKVGTVPSSYLLTNDKKTMRRVLLLVVLSLEVTTTNHWWVLPYQSPMEPSRRALLDVLPMRMVSSVCASTVSHPSVFLISVTRPSLSRFFVQIVIWRLCWQPMPTIWMRWLLQVSADATRRALLVTMLRWRVTNCAVSIQTIYWRAFSSLTLVSRWRRTTRMVLPLLRSQSFRCVVTNRWVLCLTWTLWTCCLTTYQVVRIHLCLYSMVS